jgi:hypothetical protein
LVGEGRWGWEYWWEKGGGVGNIGGRRAVGLGILVGTILALPINPTALSKILL